MTALLLAPHADDETLFAAFTCMHFRPLIVICFDAADPVRRLESGLAAQTLGCELEQWVYSEDRLLPRDFFELLLRRDEHTHFDRVFAPAVEDDGHEQHNAVGRTARAVFGSRVTGYLTYTRSGGRSTNGDLVATTPEMIRRKLAALACYQSQIDRPATRPWFYEQLDMREWLGG